MKNPTQTQRQRQVEKSNKSLSSFVGHRIIPCGVLPGIDNLEKHLLPFLYQHTYTKSPAELISRKTVAKLIGISERQNKKERMRAKDAGKTDGERNIQK